MKSRIIPTDTSVVGLAGVLFTIIFAACGTNVEWTRLVKNPRPIRPKSPADVEVFISKNPEKEYTEVGFFEAQQASEFSSDGQSEILAAMREAAAKKGCDALVMAGSADRVVGGGSSFNGNGSSHVSTLKGYRAICIVY